MRFLMDDRSYQDMLAREDHTPDCYVRGNLYLHHLYVDGVKYVVARALVEQLRLAENNNDQEAIQHLTLHKKQLDALYNNLKQNPGAKPSKILGDPPPNEDADGRTDVRYIPPTPRSLEDTGLDRQLIYEMVLRTIYYRGRPRAGEIARIMGIPYQVIGPIMQEMRQKDLIDIVGQSGIGDLSYEYMLKPPRGQQALDDALKKTEYYGPAPVPFSQYLAVTAQQTIRKLTVNRRNIRKAFSDLIITDAVLNEIGPAINSADSIFLFGYAGNGKTSIAERIARLMGDEIYIPYAIEADGQIIQFYDPIVHLAVKNSQQDSSMELENPFLEQANKAVHDYRWIKIKRPTIIVGGELTLPMLDLAYNEHGKFYEAPLQMKANNGIFMIDDFGRQMVRPLDLLNRWIVPLEKKYDYLSTVTGNKIQVPFDVLLIFSTNLDPNQLVDEAFLRRIKYKIEVRDPDQKQWRRVWELVCTQNKVQYDPQGIEYLLNTWYAPHNRPLRMCHPRDLLNHMMNIAAYNMESISFSPDLIDAACQSYFVTQEERHFAGSLKLS